MNHSKCPYCGKPIEVQPYVVHNARSYDKAVLARTECCGKGIQVARSISLVVAPYEGIQTHDDWAVPFNPSKPEDTTTKGWSEP